MDKGSAYLLIIGNREALAWILANKFTAFAEYRNPGARRLRQGDRLFLYTTRGCFKNPGRDEGRVIALATVQAEPEHIDPPLNLAGRDFTIGCPLNIPSVAPYVTGVTLRDHIPVLRAFPNKETWAIRLRRSLVPLPDADATLLAEHLKPLAVPLERGREGYMRWLPPARAVRLPATLNRAGR